jgi:hypothetical protein
MRGTRCRRDVGAQREATAKIPPAKVSQHVHARRDLGLPVDPSVAGGVPRLHEAIISTSGQVRLVVAYSEDSLVAEQEKRNLATDPAALCVSEIGFLFVAAPFRTVASTRASPDRLPGFTSTGAAQPFAVQLLGDFPAYLNPLSLANALAGLVYVHRDRSPDALDLETDLTLVKTVQNSVGGTDTYVFVPAEHLPLLRQLRDVSALLRTTALTEPVVGAIESTVRVLLGYDRQNLNPEVPTRFSPFTPPAKNRGGHLRDPRCARTG